MSSIAVNAGRAPERLLSRAVPARRVVFLDVLRFVAAGAVVAQHTLETRGEVWRQFVAIVSPGVFGVVLFFAISGFVIPMTAEPRFDLRRFAIRRVFRIFPLVFATFLVIAGLEAAMHLPGLRQAALAGPKVWLANLLLVQDYVGVPPIDGVTWTLSLELVWYAIFALGYWRAGARFDALLVRVAPLGMVLLSCASLLLDHRLPLGRIGLIYVAILGCRAYRCFNGQIAPGHFRRDLLVFLLVTWFSNAVAFGHFRHPNITLMQAVLPWTVAPLLFALVSTVGALRESALLNSRILGLLGAISFSTYLLHPVAMALAARYASAETSFPVTIAITLALSWAGYRLVELPGQSLGRLVAGRGSQRAPGRGWRTRRDSNARPSPSEGDTLSS